MGNNVAMSIPDWTTFVGGTTKRIALWLAADIGEGGVFTKEQLREAFPSVAQADRRARDLRDEGWIIDTNAEDASLLPGEQRLVQVGGRVWEAGYRTQKARAISSVERARILAADGYACTLCGVSAGEQYDEISVRKAKLVVARVQPHGSDAPLMTTLCDRCHRGKPELPDAGLLRADIEQLAPDQRDRLAAWITADKRLRTPEERIWIAYRRLPADARTTIASILRPE